MGENIAVYVGFVLFGIFLLGLILFALMRSWQQAGQVALDSVRTKLRQLHSRLGDFRASFQSYSPGDPEPFGSLIEAALDKFLGVELVLRGLFERYADLHGSLAKLRSVRGWRLIHSPLLWYKKRAEIVVLAADIVTFEHTLGELFEYRERLAQLNSDVARNCQAILQASNQAASEFEKLDKLGLRGQLLERAREGIRNWQTTILNQVPVLFFSTDSEIIRSQTDKEATAKVHRLNQAAGPEINQLLENAGAWSQDYKNFLDCRERLRGSLPELSRIMQEMSHAELFPVEWVETKEWIDRLSVEVERLDTLAANHDVADLHVLASDSNQLYEELIQLSEKLVDLRSDHLELCSLHLSEDMTNGSETLKSAYQLLETISPYNANNFLRGDAVENLKVEINNIASIQGRYLRYSASTAVMEQNIRMRLDHARNLTLQYKSIAPRIQSIAKRLAEIQGLERSAISKLGELQAMATGVGTLMDEILPLRKAVGSEHLKLKGQAEVLSVEFSRKEKDTIEKKAERCQTLYSRALKDLEKWSDILAKEITGSHNELTSQIGLLRDLVWIDDPVMVEVEYLLSSGINPSPSVVIGSGADDRIEKRFENLVSSCEIYQRYENALHQIDQVAGPILKSYRQVESLRGNVNEIMEKLAGILPQAEEPWPPTNIRVGSEQVKISQLEKEWASLKKGRIKPTILSDKLSSLLEDYKSLEARASQSLEMIRQEQARFNEYQRRLEESQKMWKKVAADYIDNRFVRDGIYAILDGADQDVQRLRIRYSKGEIVYAQALLEMRKICRKLDEEVVEIDQSQFVDINGEIQRRL